jgi:hypothetical protein
MKKLISAVFTAVLLVSMVPGTSTALARDAETGEDVAVAVESANVTVRQVYAVDDATMSELDRLIKMLSEAEEKGDKELVAALQEKIRVIKEETDKANAAGTTTKATTAKAWTEVATAEPAKPQVVETKPVTSAGGTGTVTVSNASDSCRELQAVQEKKKYYEELYGLTDDELKAKGYTRGRAEIQNVLVELDEMMTRLRKECETGSTVRAGSEEPERTRTETTASVTLVTMPTPVAVQSATEITDYYKRRIAEIATEESDIDEKITVLKELRNEIDKLIEALIKSKDSINTKEVKGLVEKIQVKPGQVTMDKVTVATTNKKVVARISDRDLEIKPASAQVIVNDGAVEVKAQEISIENEALKVGEVEVKLMPSAAVANVNITPKEVELTEEDNKPVYRIKTDENRKLLGIIPVKVEKTITVDAASTDATVIKEKRPWWAFLTTGSQ